MSEHQIFGTKANFENSHIVLIPVSWDVTTSYGRGTKLGPRSILEASPQIDLYDYDFGNVSDKGIFLLPESPDILKLYNSCESLAKDVIDFLHENLGLENVPKDIFEKQKKVNYACDQMVEWVKQKSLELLSKNKIVGVIGGDHSCPLGLLAALTEKYNGNFGILHIDAHADLRNAFHGFLHSHASIMFNSLNLNPKLKKLVQVGIRDFCFEEKSLIENNERIKTFYGPQIHSELSCGVSWNILCEQIVRELPQNVYISFDIDGLNPEFCPNTGTPVPGGLSFSHVEHLFRTLEKSKKNIIGFDLCEVAPDPENKNEWDGNVGSRILYKLCGLAK
jgi:agmatinase